MAYRRVSGFSKFVEIMFYLAILAVLGGLLKVATQCVHICLGLSVATSRGSWGWRVFRWSRRR
jgi:hypothetical protein